MHIDELFVVLVVFQMTNNQRGSLEQFTPPSAE